MQQYTILTTVQWNWFKKVQKQSGCNTIPVHSFSSYLPSLFFLLSSSSSLVLSVCLLSLLEVSLVSSPSPLPLQTHLRKKKEEEFHQYNSGFRGSFTSGFTMRRRDWEKLKRTNVTWDNNNAAVLDLSIWLYLASLLLLTLLSAYLMSYAMRPWLALLAHLHTCSKFSFQNEFQTESNNKCGDFIAVSILNVYFLNTSTADSI